MGLAYVVTPAPPPSPAAIYAAVTSERKQDYSPTFM